MRSVALSNIPTVGVINQDRPTGKDETKAFDHGVIRLAPSAITTPLWTRRAVPNSRLVELTYHSHPRPRRLQGPHALLASLGRQAPNVSGSA